MISESHTASSKMLTSASESGLSSAVPSLSDCPDSEKPSIATSHTDAFSPVDHDVTRRANGGSSDECAETLKAMEPLPSTATA
jgi:hypothetical protein